MMNLRNKMNEKKGFTLAELLIVVAIIAVLVAIAIPVFTSQLEKSREATDLANLRSAYGEAISAYLTDGTAQTVEVKANQTKVGWESLNGGTAYIGSQIGSGNEGRVQVPSTVAKGASGKESFYVKVAADGTVTITENAS